MVAMAGIIVTAIVGYGFYKGDRMSTVDARMANAAMQAKLEAMDPLLTSAPSRPPVSYAAIYFNSIAEILSSLNS